MQTAERSRQDSRHSIGRKERQIYWKREIGSESESKRRREREKAKGGESDGERGREIWCRERERVKSHFIHWKYHFLGIALALIQLTFHTDKKPSFTVSLRGLYPPLLLFCQRLLGGRIIWILTIELLKNNPFLSPSSISIPTSAL